MKRIACLAALALPLTLAPALGQHAQPYAGWQARPIKALSADETADLEAGRGMGLALAAELNGYPGPSHVIALADELHLTPAQRERAQALLAAMKAEAVPLGAAVIAAERALDRQFATRTVTPASLAAATEQVGLARATLRAAHLKYHLAMRDLLTPEQAERYRALRGYAGATPDGAGAHRHMR